MSMKSKLSHPLAHFYRHLLRTLPLPQSTGTAGTGCVFSFVYGSGAFPQARTAGTKPGMLDFVLAVNNPKSWHTENMELNPHHYSLPARILGGQQVGGWLQGGTGAGIYYNTLVEWKDPSSEGHNSPQLIKYGVVDVNTLCDDLRDWNTVYLSGRLHKPVCIVDEGEGDDSGVMNLYRENLAHAVRVARLCLPEKFTERDLYLAITAISYMGDLRMTFGENPHKIANIVDGNLEAFSRLYASTVDSCPGLHMVQNAKAIGEGKGEMEQDISLQAKDQIESELPKCLREGMGIDKGANHHERLCGALATLVRASSSTQALKGIFSAGLGKSVRYSLEKLRKMQHGKKQK
eukprot:Nk52_evm4s1779 gene=Nk52_evmTU4s1779